jgi:hypothetical protein
LHNIVVSLSPVPAAFQLPAVDDVTYEIEMIAIVVFEEI